MRDLARFKEPGMVFRDALSFFSETVWLEKIEALPWYKRSIYRVSRTGYIVVKGFTDEHLNQQAAALTYVSFLSIIPLLAVLFSLAKGFGFQEKLEPFIRDALHLIEPEILNQIIEYVSETNVAALGALGFLFLLWTVLKTLLNLERSFNQIWSVQRCRPLYRALAYYLCVMLIVPFLVIASTTLMAALHTGEGGWLEGVPGGLVVVKILKPLLPFLITWVAFSLVYSFMVNTNVRLRSAISGAFVASLLWNFLQVLYIETQVGLSKNAIYGTFAFLPIFLVYLMLCWLIILFGCRIAFALQHEDTFRRDRMALAAGMRYRTSAGLLVLHEIARAFDQGQTIEKPVEIADRLDLPLPLVMEMLTRLTQAEILCRVESPPEESDESRALVPARALDKIAVKDVVLALEDHEGVVPMPKAALFGGPVQEVLERAGQARDDALEGITVRDLVGG
jgi:membrane protein